jgi:diguanylate cyclase (GGDEF)-like protein
MIRTYTTNQAIIEAVSTAAKAKGYDSEFYDSIDPAELDASIEDISILIFDLSETGLAAERVMGLLDTLDPELAPPVLYLLASPDNIELIAQAGNIFNQDYSFLPLEPVQLAGRLEVLSLLGKRRKLTLETAIMDRLTGLYNRKYFLRRLEEELYRAARYKYSVGVLMAAIDFSTPDNTLTEQTGTTVIQEISEFLKGRLRKSDIIARFKWDDFAFLLPDISLEDSMLVAQDVRQKLEQLEVSVDDSPVSIKVYIGHALLPIESLSNAVEVVEALEDCIFKAKSNSQEGITSYEPVAG